MTGIDYHSDELFNTNDTYKLSLIFSEDNFLYALSSRISGKIMAVKEFDRAEPDFFNGHSVLEKIFKDENLFDDRIKEVNAAIVNKDFMLVPAQFYNPEAKKRLLQNITVKTYLEDFKVLDNKIDSAGAVSIYIFPAMLYDFLQSQYKKVRYFHANDALVNNAIETVDKDDFLLANFNYGYLQTIVFKNKKFIQSNVYSLRSKEDILYRILHNLQNQAMPVNSAGVILSGRLERDSAIFELIYNHIKNTGFIRNISRYNFSNVFLGKPVHLFYDLYALDKCA